jgi:hypothetical protein
MPLRRILSIFAILTMCFLFCIPSFAAENDNSAVETGTVTFVVDATKNRPMSFDSYNCFVELSSDALNIASPTEGIFNIMSYNDYSATYELPYGTYSVVRGGVIGDSFGEFSMSPDITEFILSKDNDNLVIRLSFDNMDHTTGSKVDSDKIIEDSTDYVPEKEKKIDSNLITLIGIFSVILGVVIVFCLVILSSVKKYKREM